MKKELNELRNITRFDQDPRPDHEVGTHGWWVRFQVEGKRLTQLFSDNKFGGKKKALQAAQTYRDAIEREVRPKQTGHHANIKTRRNRSGIVGVNRAKNTTHRNGKRYISHVWQAHWSKPDGKVVNRSFSIKKYGEEEALRLAIKTRLEGLSQLIRDATPVFNPPPNPNVKIWRYMDFTKYMSILEKKSLYFPLISELNDPFEGSFSRGNKQFRPLVYKHLEPKIDIGALVRKLRFWVAVSCWHMSDHESAAMWNLYSKSEEAICIQSTYNEFRNVLGVDVEIGTVQYVDYERDWIPEDHPLLPFLYKRKSFEHESEIRAIINLSPVESLRVERVLSNAPKHGIQKEVNLSKLIHRIYIAPHSAPWLFDLVKNVSITYGLANIEVIQSSLEKEPFF